MLKKYFIFCYFIFIILNIVSAQIDVPNDIPDCNYLAGDATGEGIVDISDPIKILNFLFLGGGKPCYPGADSDNNNKIDITDAIYLLSWLFRGGPAPINLDKPIEIGVRVPFSLEEIENPSETIELNAKIRDSIHIKDLSDDLFFQEVEKCVAYKGSPGGEKEEFFTTLWHLDEEGNIDEDFKGNDLKRQDMEIFIDEFNFLEGERYEISVICQDTKGNEDELTFFFNVENSETQNFGRGGGISIPDGDNSDEVVYGCKVKKMTILKAGDSAPDEMPFSSVNQLTSDLPAHNREGLGHREGYMLYRVGESRVLSYNYGYEFYVYALLKKGSNPEDCFEHQFASVRIEDVTFYPESYVPGGRVPEKKSWIVPGFMHKTNDLLNKERLMELAARRKLTERRIIGTIKKKIDISPTTCDAKTDEIKCDDDYGITYKYKKHISGEIPKIIWFDFPGTELGMGYIFPDVIFTPTTISEVIGRINGGNTGAISPAGITEDLKEIVSIIEDSDGLNRWVCKLGPIHFKNEPEKATHTKKMQLVQEPGCLCFQQEYDQTNQQWKDKIETKHYCGAIS